MNEPRELTATVVRPCTTQDCPRPAVMAISTTRSNKTIFSRVFYVEADAPASASRYCHECGVTTIVQLCSVLAAPDAASAPAVAP